MASPVVWRVCVCMSQCITSVFRVNCAELVGSVWVHLSGVTASTTVLTGRTRLIAVRESNPHAKFPMWISPVICQWSLNHLNICLPPPPSPSLWDHIPSPELLFWKPGVDASVRWELDQPPWEGCLRTTGIQEVGGPIVCYSQMKSLLGSWADVDLAASSGCCKLPSMENQQMATCTYKL